LAVIAFGCAVAAPIAVVYTFFGQIAVSGLSAIVLVVIAVLAGIAAVLMRRRVDRALRTGWAGPLAWVGLALGVMELAIVVVGLVLLMTVFRVPF
jgi:uncharacterized membrane protein YidH (DUF202 family)